jgi:aminoglycoside phosphotransferase (APT) family kinase protein
VSAVSFDDQVGTTEVREKHRFDEAALAAWMAEHVEGYAGPLRVEQFKGGQSNPTYKLITPGHAYVLRRKPPGDLIKGAHAVDREARVLSAMEKAGIPVAHVHGLCTDDSVIGTWFYIMDMVEGRIFWDATLPDVRAEDRPAYFENMNATIAKLHQVDYAALGLEDYGRPGNYFKRQIDRWVKQYSEDREAGREPVLDRIIEWIYGAIPDDEETTLVHGDYRFDNMIFHPTEPRVIAILDWELSTLGHPLADFTYHAMMYQMPSLITPGLKGADLKALNIPSEEDYAAAYCRNAGRDRLAGYDFAMAYNCFKFAAMIHGVKGRYLRGTAANEGAKARAESLPVYIDIAWQQAVKAGLR